MIIHRLKGGLPLTITVAAIAMLFGTDGAQAATPPVKLVPSSHITGGLGLTEGVAVAPGGNIYVADTNNNRVQELTPTGEFVLMFGKEVNETTKGNVCTKEEVAKGAKCKVGVEAADAGAFAQPKSIAIDPATHNIYVEDFENWRIQEFTATGEFVLMFGKEVNETTGNDICTAGEIKSTGVKCKAGIQTEGTEHDAFNFVQAAGDLLAVGPESHLYVGDELRVQVFEADGKWVREIPLTSISSEPSSKVTALAVSSTGDVYIVYRVEGIKNVIHEFNPSEVEIGEFPIEPRQPGREVSIEGIALDSEGRLAVAVREEGQGGLVVAPSGALLDGTTGTLITEFTTASSTDALSFSGEVNGELYAALETEVVGYEPVRVAALATTPVTCVPGVEHDTDETFDCSLKGEVNPWNVGGTEVWFQWGKTPGLGSETAKIAVATGETPVPVSITVPAVPPGETAFYYRLAGYDQHVQSPESPLLSSPVASFPTPMVAPKIVAEPSASFIRASAAVIFDELNPENAKTEYFFEYGTTEVLKNCPEGLREAEEEKATCTGVSSTSASRSKAYGKIGTTQEVTGLQPDQTYHYRLYARSESADGKEQRHTIGPEGEFATSQAPAPQALTGTASMITSTSAVVSGRVDPDGQSATYVFELGVYEGAQTRYGVVSSGQAGAGTTPLEESLTLTGLQPGTTYAYRVTISSGYITNETHTLQGAPATFTTAGLPSVLALPPTLAQLPVPSIAFPAEAKGTTTTTKTLTNAQKLTKALKACKRKPKKQRAGCQKQARRQYAPAARKKKK